MNKLLIITVLLVSIFSKSWCQSLVIDDLNVSHFKIIKNPNIFIEGERDGPFIRFSFTIDNNTDKDIFLNTDSDNLTAIFKYNKEKYREDMIWESLKKIGNLKISARSSRKFTTSTYLFLGTSLLVKNKYDYTLELLEVLPTLRLKYNDGKLKLLSTAIDNVIIKN